jgi:hypothetical protein
MPAYNKGNVIRGGFGSTFRRIVCHANCREPETCELRSVCPYTAVFQPFVPEGSEKISKNRDDRVASVWAVDDVAERR